MRQDRTTLHEVIGYFASQNTAPRIDLGPEFSPEQREARQQFERGFTAYVDLARRQPPPTDYRDPAYQQYYASMRELQSSSPEYAAELAEQAAIVGHMADLRRGRRLRMRPPPLAQSPYVALPLPPGYSAAEIATIGMPVRYWDYR